MSLEEQKDFITGPQIPIGNTWFDQTQVRMAKMLGAQCPASPPTDPAALENYHLHLQYYDLGKSLYTVHRRTNDPLIQTYARNAADSWWQHPWIGEGKARPWENNASPPPRHAGIGGLILRALDGRREMWDFCVAYTQAFLNIYLKWRLTGEKIHVDVREGAFTFHYATWLAHVLPDTFPLQAGGTATNGAEIRAQLHADLEKITSDYYARLQRPCGCWVYDVHTADQIYLGITQPFTLGLLLLAFADFHQITKNETTRELLKTMILKTARHLYLDGPYRKDDRAIYDPNIRLRFFWYTYHGGTVANPTLFEKGGDSWPGNNAGEIREGRQSIGPVIGIYGWAARNSTDPIYLEALREMWDSAYGDSDGGIRTYMDTDGKGFNQHCARAGSALAWTGAVDPPPPPVEKVPSPDGTKAASIVDSEGKEWTLGPNKETLRDGVQMGGGQGKVYKYQDKVVYTLGMDSNWWKWAGSWSMKSPDPKVEPGVIVPPPPPPPPPPPVATTRKVAWPKTEAAQEATLNLQWLERYRLKTTKVSGDWAIFEFVPK